jgi:signal transduction histidine kinase
MPDPDLRPSLPWHAAALAVAVVLAVAGQGLLHYALGLQAELYADARLADGVATVRALGGGLLALALAAVAVTLGSAAGRVRRALRRHDADLAEARRQLVAFEADLRASQDAVAAAERTRAAILTNMSHEIRTPLTGILGCADLLRVEAGGGVEHLVDPIERNGRRLLGALDSILLLAQLEGGGGPAGGRASAEAEAAEVVARARPEAEAKGLGLTLQADADADVRADRAALSRAIGNVVDNAVRFTERGAVAVTVRSMGPIVEVRVGDTGPGIDPAFMPRLFEAFEQGSTGDARTHEGVGLGLAVAGRLVRQMGGEVDVESELGRGTAVTFRLPAAPPAPPGGAPPGGDGAAVPSGHVTARPAPRPAPVGV